MASDNQVDIPHILDVAAMMFAEIGYEGVSMRQIAKASGVPVTSIYYHFPSKQQLFEEAFTNKLEEIEEDLNLKLMKLGADEKSLDTLIEVVYRMLRDDQVISLLMNRDIIAHKLSHKPLLAQREYQYFSGVIRKYASEYVGRDIGAEYAFTCNALFYGYAELGQPSRMAAGVSSEQLDEILLGELKTVIKGLLKNLPC